MTPVTDPNIISQLEGGNNQLTPVTDPALIAQLEGTSAPGTPANNTPWYQSLGNGLINGVIGTGDALAKNIDDTLDLIPGVNIQANQGASGTAYDAGRMGGNALAFIGGGEGLDALRAGLAAKNLPIVSQAAQYLGGDGIAGALRRALGAGTYGAVTNPNDRGTGALEGGALSAGLDTIPAAYGLIRGGLNAISPQKYADQFLQTLGGGNSLENNAQSIAKSIRNAFQSNKEQGNALYNSVYSNLPSGRLYSQDVSPGNQLSLLNGGDSNAVYSSGNSNLHSGRLYQQERPLLNNASSQYLNLPPEVTGQFDLATQGLHNQFLNDPTFENATQLRSQLGSTLGQIGKKMAAGGSNQAERNEYMALGQARNALNGDISSYFTQINRPDLQDAYNAANAYWRQNVIPFTSSSLAKFATSKTTNPTISEISTAFKSPEPDVENIVNNIGSSLQNKILYNELAKNLSQRTPEGLLQNFAKAGDQGLSSYITPEAQQSFDTLSKKVNFRNALNTGIGVTAGYTIGHGVGAPLFEVLGALGGAKFIPGLMRKATSSMPNLGIGSSIQSIAPYLRQALIANTVGGQ